MHRRTAMLGLMLAGAMLPAMAGAQDRRPDNPRKWADDQRELPTDGEGRPDRPARPQPQPQVQVQAQAQPSFRPERDRRGGGGGQPGFQPQAAQPQQPSPQGDPRGFGGRGRFDRGAGQQGDDRSGRDRGGRGDDARVERDRSFGGDRFAGRPPAAPGSGGYRAPDGRGTGGVGFQDRRGQDGYRGTPGFRPGVAGRGGRWDRDWRGYRQFDYSRYRVQNRAAFHLPRYAAPRGWGYGYRRFAPGLTLSAVLFDQDYWIDDPYTYRLPPAWEPYRWVRYYNDALLIDLRTGGVVDAVYDIFW